MIPQPQTVPVTQQPISTLAEARQFSNGLMDIMTELLGVIEQETKFVRAGKLRDSMKLAQRKNELSQRYFQEINRLKTNKTFLMQSAPELLQALHQHHDVFRAMLQVNLTVLATAHSVSEGLIRGVNTEIRKNSMPQTYTAAGRRAMPNPRHAAPLSINRAL
jgi:hypothetical protein